MKPLKYILVNNIKLENDILLLLFSTNQDSVYQKLLKIKYTKWSDFKEDFVYWSYDLSKKLKEKNLKDILSKYTSKIYEASTYLEDDKIKITVVREI